LWVCCESVFVNDFLFCSSLCAMQISASAVELCSGEGLWVYSESVFVNDFLSAVVFVAWRFQLLP
jgi:hypothetical protein